MGAAIFLRDSGSQNGRSCLSHAKALDKADYGWTTENRVKTLPRDFAEHEDHRHADYIRMKNLIVPLDLPKAAWIDVHVVDRVETFARNAALLLMFGKAAL